MLVRAAMERRDVNWLRAFDEAGGWNALERLLEKGLEEQEEQEQEGTDVRNDRVLEHALRCFHVLMQLKREKKAGSETVGGAHMVKGMVRCLERK
eukprot:767427-Hanusia_phi.AAC.4